MHGMQPVAQRLAEEIEDGLVQHQPEHTDQGFAQGVGLEGLIPGAGPSLLDPLTPWSRRIRQRPIVVVQDTSAAARIMHSTQHDRAL